jgi:hypothetical protein
MDSPLERLEVRNYSVSVEGDAFYISGQIMSTELLPEKVLRSDIKKLVGKELRLEHAIVELEPYAMVGEVVDVWWDERLNQPFGKAIVYNDTEVENELRKDLLDDQKKPVAERKYKGFSIGIINKRDKKTKESLKIFPRELTITSSPVCKPCTINSVGEYSKMSVSPKDLELLKDQFSKQLKDIEAKLEESSDAEETGAAQVLTTKLKEKTTETEEYKIKMAAKETEVANLKESLRRAEVSPVVGALLDACQYSKDSEIFKQKQERWMKLDKATLADFADSLAYVTKLYSQSNPIIGGNQGLPIENFGKQVDNGVGLIEMPERLARRLL